jgi:hypothetical protein
MKHKFNLQSGLVLMLIMGTGVLTCLQPSNASAGQSGTAAIPTNTRQVAIIDPQYQMTAATLNVPSGWKFTGTVAHLAGCHAAQYPSVEYTILSPDGVTAIAALPGSLWRWSTSPTMQQIMAKSPCPGVDIKSAAGFLVNIAVPNMRPGAKMIGVVPMPAANRAALAKLQASLRQQFPRQRAIVEGAGVRIQYRRKGQPVEEIIYASINCTVITMAANLGQASSDSTTCGTQNILVIRTPQGHLDQLLAQPQLMAIVSSLHDSNDWLQRIVKDNQASFQQATNEFNKRAQAIRDAGNQAEDRLVAKATAEREQNDRVSAVSRANAQAAQNATDIAAHNTVNYALDRRDYVNPATGQTINASSEYTHQWMSSDGSTLIQTNDHGYDPNGQVAPVSQAWTELIPQ